MGKIGVGKHNSDLDISLTTRGTKNALAVELIDESGNIIGSIGPSSSGGQGNGTVATAGTAVQLSSSSVSCRRVIVTAQENNPGNIVIGFSGVVADASSRTGVFLFPTQSQAFFVNNLNLLYVDATANGCKFHYYYES